MKYKKIILFISLAICLPSCLAITSTIKAKKISGVFEIVTFKTNNKYSSKKIINLANSVTPILESYHGFLSRNLFKDVNNSSNWVDVVHWASFNEAQSAAKKITKTIQMKNFISTMNNYRMNHFKIKDSEKKTTWNMINLIFLFFNGIISWLLLYLNNRIKNAATKKDIGKITEEIQKVKIEYLLKQNKSEKLLEKQIQVFEEIQSTLVRFKKYALCALGEFQAGELHERLNNIPDSEFKAALPYLTELDNLIIRHSIFIPENTSKVLDKLFDKLSLLPSMELAAMNSEIQKSPKLYEKAIDLIDNCLSQMKKDIFNYR